MSFWLQIPKIGKIFQKFFQLIFHINLKNFLKNFPQFLKFSLQKYIWRQSQSLYLSSPFLVLYQKRRDIDVNKIDHYILPQGRFYRAPFRGKSGNNSGQVRFITEEA
jgi:hypothetical protein